MTSSAHGRYDFWPIHEPAPFQWPEGGGLAFYTALNLEQYAFGEGLVDELVPSPGPGPDVLNHAWLDYGNRVGAYRLLDLFREAGLPLTCLVSSHLYDTCPDLISSFRRSGHEIAAHGRTNAERQDGLSEEDERALIAEATARIAAAEGASPRGWLGPWIAESAVTPDLLQEAGYCYLLDWCCDDRPIVMRTRGGPILAMPYPQEANDANAIAVRRMTARDFADLIVDQFDEMLHQAEGGDTLVCALSLHPHICGQPHRLRPLRKALRHIADKRERIWPTTAGRIADIAWTGYGLD
jgi:peptidoglycan/xylan/chitin deacetylase (PgdA/CDA1 family)